MKYTSIQIFRMEKYMKFISELQADEKIVTHYLCKQKQSLKTRSGKTYLSLKLQDKTGVIDGKVWELNNDIQSFEENDYIKIDAIVLTYQNELQLKITKIRKSREGEYYPQDYIPTTDKDIESLYKQLLDYIKSIQNPFIKQLLNNILVKDEKITSAFKVRSAAKQMHHSYMGGLLEHTLNVVQICDFLADFYRSANRDILLCTAMLHDIGKVYELTDFPSNEYTDDGQLLGHLVMGAQMIKDEASRIPEFPHALSSLLQHSILSHHGEYEYGSPKRPKTIEAFILHMADDLDAKVKMLEDAIDNNNTVGSWIGFQKMLQRNIRRSNF